MADRDVDAYPVLTDAQVARIAPYGEELATSAGDVLFREGEDHYDLYVVLEGRIGVRDESADGEARLAVSFPAGEFLGEMGLLFGETTFATCVVEEPGRVLRVPQERVLELVGADPELSGILLRAFAARREIVRSVGSGMTIVGSRRDADAVRLAEFARRNYLAFRWLDLEDDLEAATAFAAAHGHTVAQVRDTPIVVWGTRTVLQAPSNRDLARVVGIGVDPLAEDVVDVAVVGAGPAGLAAAVYGASEGLSTLVVDSVGIGGQAGSSSRIENYLGFPAGLSGTELASRAVVQAQRLGARFVVPYAATRMERLGGPGARTYRITLDSGESVVARSVVLSTGVEYRRLPLDRLEEFEGVGVYYAATFTEARICGGGTAVVVGGGNSAGQAAVFLADHASRVLLLLRSGDLTRAMSRYLSDRVQRHPRIDVRLRTEIVALEGEGSLEAVTLRTPEGEERVTTPAVFSFIGASPCTGWLDGIALDDKGFVLTSEDLPSFDVAEWGPAGRSPLPFETSLPGVFAVGDLRSGSVKRVAGAVGEGSVAISRVHEHLAALGGV